MSNSPLALLRGVLASQAPRPASKYLGTYNRGIQTSAALSRIKLSRLKRLVEYVTEQALAKEPLTDQRPEEKPSIIQRLNPVKREGDNGISAKMHLKALLNDNNAEKAWMVWSTRFRQGDSSDAVASEEDMTKLLLLLVDWSTSLPSTLFAGTESRANEDYNH
ncbi:hypothetical protein GGI23_005739, partial [Coemansia sp. RSA 2559]